MCPPCGAKRATRGFSSLLSRLHHCLDDSRIKHGQFDKLYTYFIYIKDAVVIVTVQLDSIQMTEQD
jgi:hypothetical protein